MKKTNSVYIEDIIRACEKILSYSENITYDQFIKNEILKDALVRNIEIIGEASNRLNENFEENHPEFPLVNAITMRNKLIHDYDQIDFDIVWETVIHDIPELLSICEKILAKESI